MKLRKILSVLIVLFASFQFIFGQEKSEAILVDEFGKECSETVIARYDGYFSKLQNNPSAQAYILFYGEKSVEGKNLNFVRYLKDIYPTFRGFDKSKISIVRGANQEGMKTQFWLVPAGANPPEPETIFVEEKHESTERFDRSWADFHRWFGSLEIYSDGFLDLGCEFSPNRLAFAKILNENSNLTGYLIIYTKFGKGVKRGNQIAGFALRELVKNHKVPRKRLKTIYGGNRQEPEIELWFVPNGDKPPTPTPDKKRKAQ